MKELKQFNDVIYAREPRERSIKEATELFEAHYQEIAKHQDIPLNVDWDAYKTLEEAGKLMAFSARTTAGELIGYAVFVVSPSPHYKDSLQANQDVLYVAPQYRQGRVGVRLIKFCDDYLRECGVQVVTQHVKIYADFSPLLKALGYEQVETIWQKRLDL